MTNDTTQQKGGFHYAFLIVATGIVICCVPCALVLSCAGIFFTPVSDYFGVPKASFTLYFSIMNVAMMVCLPFAGKLMSKRDVRVVLSTCVVACALCLIAFSRLTAVWQFYIVGAVLGFGIAPLIYLAVPSLINAWCKKKVGFFVGLCMAFTGIGGVIFNPVGSALIATGAEGWRTGYLVFGLLCLIALPFTAFVIRSHPSDKGLQAYGYDEARSSEAEASPQVDRGVPAAKAMKTAAFFAVAAFCGLITINQTVYQFLPSYVAALAQGPVPELSAQLAAVTGGIASACMAGQAIGKVVLGSINDKSVKGGLSFGIGCGIVGVLLMWFLPQWAVVLFVGSFLFGCVYACTTVQSPLLTRSVFGPRDYTNIYSRVSMVGSACSAVAAVFWAWIVDLPSGYALMFILSIAIMAVSFGLGIFALGQVKKLKTMQE